MSVQKQSASITSRKAFSAMARWLGVACLVAGLGCCAQAQDKDKAQEKDKPSAAAQTDKIEVRNNAASLLADMLNQEKNVSKILIIKHPPAETARLVKEVSKAAGDGAKQLEAMAKDDPTLKLDMLQLPAGEKAARAAEAEMDKHSLLSTSGPTFEFNLLLTQVQAMGYGSNLAKVASQNCTSEPQARAMHALEVSLSGLYRQLIVRMRGGPGKS